MTEFHSNFSRISLCERWEDEEDDDDDEAIFEARCTPLSTTKKNLPTSRYRSMSDETSECTFYKGQRGHKEIRRPKSDIKNFTVGGKLDILLKTEKFCSARGSLDFVIESGRGLEAGFRPKRVDVNSEGGCYFLQDSKGLCGVFKPCDEEPGSPLSPRGVQQLVRRGVPVGGGFKREVAAYLLDHDSFAGVPDTTIIRLKTSNWPSPTNSSNKPFATCSEGLEELSVCEETKNPSEEPRVVKTGSLQRFISHHSSADDVGPLLLPLDYIQRIGVLDVRCINLDRHGGNILIQTVQENSRGGIDSLKTRSRRSESFCGGGLSGQEIRLVPIDHGLSLPDITDLSCGDDSQEDADAIVLEWINWPKAKSPFLSHVVRYIEKLDAQADSAMLRNALSGALSERELASLTVGTMLLKHMVMKNKTLYDIGKVIQSGLLKTLLIRADIDQASNFESLKARSNFFARFQGVLSNEFQ